MKDNLMNLIKQILLIIVMSKLCNQQGKINDLKRMKNSIMGRINILVSSNKMLLYPMFIIILYHNLSQNHLYMSISIRTFLSHLMMNSM